MEEIFREKMEVGVREAGLELSEKQMEQFYRYYELLVEWNKVMNLTGRGCRRKAFCGQPCARARC